MNRALRIGAALALLGGLACGLAPARAQTPVPVVPKSERSKISAERTGTHDAANIRTIFYNFGMVGDYPLDPQGVDLSVFHSVEVPKGTGMNYSDGITPFVLAKIPLKPRPTNPAERDTVFLMETGFRERQAESPYTERIMRFEPRPGYFEPDPGRNPGRSIAISSDPRTWPSRWPDKASDPDDPGWHGSWNGYFGKRASADQESYSVMDDDFYDALKPRWLADSSRDTTRGGLGLKVGVRGFQWANPQAENVIFWHYDITNESTTDYNDNIVFGLYMDSGVGGSLLSCDGIFESDDDNASFDKSSGLNLVYTFDNRGHGRDLRGNCSPTGYLGYAYLETPGNPFNDIDDDNDGIKNERRDSGPGTHIVGQQAILDYVVANYDTTKFVAFYGPIQERPAYRAGSWWTGDEDMDWVAEFNDVGADGVKDTHDTGEGDGIPTSGEPNFDKTDLNESDQIGLTGFKYNKIKAGEGNQSSDVDGILFYTDTQDWPERLYNKWVSPDSAKYRFDPPLVNNYNIGFLFASGPFSLKAGQTERFSLALAYGQDLPALRRTVKTVQQIYDGNYQFAVAPTRPIVHAETGDHTVRLTWDDAAERSVDPVTNQFDFEGYRIYRSTDPDFLDARIVTDASGQPSGNGQPIAQFDLANGITGYYPAVIENLPSYFLGTDTGITHTYEDPTVTNGQTYYYAVCAYDHGSQQPLFYPSENSYSISRTLRGGVLYPTNVVQVRPNPRVTGYERATLGAPQHVSGRGFGQVQVQVANSTQIPSGHRFRIEFEKDDADSVRANHYALVDSTTGETWFTTGNDFVGGGRGPIGAGILPIVSSNGDVAIDADSTRFAQGSPTNAKLRVSYLPGLPVELKRPGFPENLEIRFSDSFVDTSVSFNRRPTKPAKFRIFALTDTGETRMRFAFLDTTNATTSYDGTLTLPLESIEVITTRAGEPDSTKDWTWRIQLDPSGPSGSALRPPAAGDVFRIRLKFPFEPGDVFSFNTTAETTAPGAAAGKSEPYVVPNPYLGAASFEPAPFNIKGRGERRIEFRGVAQGAVVRIYNVHGDLVQTLRQDGSFDGFVPWNLRTKDNLDVAPGLYVYRVEAAGQPGFTGKFAVVK